MATIGIVWLLWTILSGTKSDLMTPALVSGTLRAIALCREPLAAELVAEHGSVGGQPPPASRRDRRSSVGTECIVPGALDFQCPVLSSACDGIGPARVSFELQPDASGTGPSAADYAALDRPPAVGSRREAAVGHAAVVAQRAAALSPRPGPVVAMPDLLWPVGALLRQHPPVQLQPRLFGDDRFSEPGGRRPDSFDVYHAVHLSHGELGRAAVLDPRDAADQARRDLVDEVRIRGDRFVDPLLRARWC